MSDFPENYKAGLSRILRSSFAHLSSVSYSKTILDKGAPVCILRAPRPFLVSKLSFLNPMARFRRVP